jgi:hypothetical protein
MRFDDFDDYEEDRPARQTTRPRESDTSYYAEAEIQHGLGRLGVDRRGLLAGIEFDETALRRMRPDPLGDYLLAALHAAEETARRKRMSEHRR